MSLSVKHRMNRYSHLACETRLFHLFHFEVPRFFSTFAVAAASKGAPSTVQPNLWDASHC